MSEKKNIDRFFQEKFKDFEVEPSEKVWKNIESKLKERNEIKENRKVIPFWLKLSGIAAALLIGYFTTDTLLNYKKDKEPKIVIKESKNPVNSDFNSKENKEVITSSEVSDAGNKKAKKVNSSKETEIPSEILDARAAKNSGPNTSGETINKNSAVAKINPKSKRDLSVDPKEKNNLKNHLKSETNKTIVSNNPKKNSIAIPVKNKRESKSIAANLEHKAKNKSELNLKKEPVSIFLANQNRIENQTLEKNTENNSFKNTNQIGVVNNDSAKKTAEIKMVSVVPNVLDEFLKEKENKMIIKETKSKKWQITSNVAPIYYGSASKGSPLDSVFKNNGKNYKTNVAYGLGLKYALNKKLSVRTGVSAVALEYNTNDVAFYQNKNAIAIKHIHNNLEGSLIQIENKNVVQVLPPDGIPIRKFDGNLNQKTGYIEVPLEMSYKMVDKKFGVEIIGGLSTLFLNENNVTLVSSGMEMNIGEANNLNTVHLSTNIGLGLKYSFLKSFQANFEPMFKYQINTYSNDSGNFKPYFIGLYTGVSYRF